MSRVFCVGRTLHGFKAKSDITMPTITMQIGPSKDTVVLLTEYESIPSLAVRVCKDVRFKKVIHEARWVVDSGMTKELSLRCSTSINPRLADQYTLLAMLAGVIALCALEEYGGGNVNSQNTVYSATYAELVKHYREVMEFQEVISQTLDRLSLEAT